MSTRTSVKRKAKPVPSAPKKAMAKPTTVHGKKQASAALATASPAAASVPRKKAGLSLKLFSRLTGFSERAIAGWEAGDPISDAASRRLLETERFHERLAQVVKPEAIPGWLETPNPAFDGLKPVEVIERGEIDRLWSMIFYLESGVAS
jgi:DNA-binding transcriptional regulator YiaG